MSAAQVVSGGASSVVVPRLVCQGSLGQKFADLLIAYRDEFQQFSPGGSSASAGQTSAGFSLAQALFSLGPRNIPNANGECFKTEWVPFREPIEGTMKINWWHGPDDQRDPHSHPWDTFTSHIITGSYTERRYWLDEKGELQTKEFTYRQGDKNVFPRDQYHLVTKVEPETMTLMLCGTATDKNVWGYIDVHTAAQRNAEPDPTFKARFMALNPFPKLV